MGASLFPDAKPWFRFDLAAPGTDRSVYSVYSGAAGGGKSWTLLRERLERGVVELPDAQAFYKVLGVFGTAAMLVRPLKVPEVMEELRELQSEAPREIRTAFYPELFASASWPEPPSWREELAGMPEDERPRLLEGDWSGWIDEARDLTEEQVSSLLASKRGGA